MNNQKLVAVVCSILFITAINFYGQSNGNVLPQDKFPYKLVTPSERSDLVIEMSSAIRLKIAVRKTEYRLGEMLVLDTAIISDTQNPLFMPSIDRLEIRAEGRLRPYKLTTKSTAFARLEPNKLQTNSFSFLIGCEEKPFHIVTSLTEGLPPSMVFDHDLFVTWGDGCLNVTAKSKLLIRAEISNDSVLVSNKFPFVKTTIGKVKSAPVEIRIKPH